MVDLDLHPPSEPPSLEGMTDAEKVAAMVEWFFDNFDDPSQETPRDSGDFVYIWGGPYDADEELQDAFSDKVPYELIERAVAEVQDRDGIYDWAPHGNRIRPENDSDRVATGEIVDGDGEWPPLVVEPENVHNTSAAKTANVLSRLDELERAVQALQLPAAGIGHNNPPEPIEATPISEEERNQLIVNIGEIKFEVRSPQPDYEKVETKAGFLARTATKIQTWIGKSLDKAIIAGLAAEYPKILDYLHAAYKAIMDWLPPHLPF